MSTYEEKVDANLGAFIKVVERAEEALKASEQSSLRPVWRPVNTAWAAIKQAFNGGPDVAAALIEALGETETVQLIQALDVANSKLDLKVSGPDRSEGDALKVKIQAFSEAGIFDDDPTFAERLVLANSLVTRWDASKPKREAKASGGPKTDRAPAGAGKLGFPVYAFCEQHAWEGQDSTNANSLKWSALVGHWASKHLAGDKAPTQGGGALSEAFLAAHKGVVETGEDRKVEGTDLTLSRSSRGQQSASNAA